MDKRIMVELSLSLPKPAWKIRTSIRRGRRGTWVRRLRCYVFTPRVGDEIMEGDAFEWMITNEEIRDILLVLKCISPRKYEEIKEVVYGIRPNNYIKWHQVKDTIKKELDGTGIFIEASMRGKQRKPEELTPYLFIVFPLDKPSKAHCIVDKRGRQVHQPVGRRIMAGDKLIWEILNYNWIRDVTVLVARLSEAHNNKLKKDVFQAIEKLGEDQGVRLPRSLFFPSCP